MGAKGIEEELAAGGVRYYWSGSLRRPRPELADISDAERRLWIGLARFGMSPSDRTRVSAALLDAKAKNPFAKLG